jgi:hypothetical protein
MTESTDSSRAFEYGGWCDSSVCTQYDQLSEPSQRNPCLRYLMPRVLPREAACWMSAQVLAMPLG